MKQDLVSPTPAALRSDHGSSTAALRALLPKSFPVLKRRARRVSFSIPSSDAPLVMDAVDSSDWGTLACLPRFDSDRLAGPESLRFVIEFSPGAAGDPAFLTVTGPARGGSQPSWLSSRLRRATLVDRRRIEPDDVQTMIALLPEMAAANDRSASGVGGARPSDLVTLFRRLGILNHRDASDFRDEAVRASGAIATESGAATSSSCSLVDAHGPARAAWREVAPYVLAALVFSAASNVAIGLTLAGVMSPGTMGLSIVATLLLSILLVRVGRRPRVRGLRALLSARAGSLLTGNGHLPSVPFKLQGGRMHYVSPLCPDDVGICLFDAPNRRILLEGLGYRYVIRGQDLRQLSPLRPVADVPVMLEYVVAGQVPLGFSLKLVQVDRASAGGAVSQPLHQLLATLQPQGPDEHAGDASGG